MPYSKVDETFRHCVLRILAHLPTITNFINKQIPKFNKYYCIDILKVVVLLLSFIKAYKYKGLEDLVLFNNTKYKTREIQIY